MKRLVWCLVFVGFVNAPVAWARIDIGYATDYESVTASGSSTHWNTDVVSVGWFGSDNRLSILNGAIVSASGGCEIAWSSFGTAGRATNNVIDVSGVGSKLEANYLEVGYGEGSFNNRLQILNEGMVVSSSTLIGVWQYDWMNEGNNKVEVVGTGSQFVSSDLTVGYRASFNSLVVSNGASAVSVNARIGYSDGVKYDGDNNRVLIAGSGSTWDSGNVRIGGDRAEGNKLEIMNGGVVTSSSASIAGGRIQEAGNNGAVISGNGSKWIISGGLGIEAPYYATGNYVRIEAGGEVVVQGGLNIYPDEEERAYSPSHIDLNDRGRLKIGTDFDASMEGFNYNSGSTLAVEGQLSGLSTLETGRRLETADLLGDMTVHGIYAPGNSPADSILNGILTLASDGTLEMELGGLMLGDEYDRLTVTGTANLDGTLDIVLLDGFTLSYGDTFDLFNWEGGVTGQFESISTSALSGELYWDTSNLYTAGTLSVIPEPGVLSLMTICGGGFWFSRRSLISFIA